jgi:hypothetical protein
MVRRVERFKGGFGSLQAGRLLLPEAGDILPCTHFSREASTMKRTTHRSSTGTKLYAVRDSKGRFKDIQTYKRAHSADLRKKSKKEKK